VIVGHTMIGLHHGWVILLPVDKRQKLVQSCQKEGGVDGTEGMEFEGQNEGTFGVFEDTEDRRDLHKVRDSSESIIQLAG